MTEVQPEILRDATSSDPAASEPQNPLTDFQALATEDPALLLQILGVPAQDLGRIGEDPSELDRQTVWSLATANRKNTENPSTQEHVEHAQETVQKVLGMFAASQAAEDKEITQHPLYKEQVFRLRLIQWASRPNPEAEAAVHRRLHEVALGIRVFGIARQSLQQSLTEAARDNPPATISSMPQQRGPAEKGTLSVA